MSFTDDVLSTWISERFVLDLRTRVFRHLHRLSLDFFDRRRLGDLTARLTGDVAAIETLMLLRRRRRGGGDTHGGTGGGGGSGSGKDGSGG